MGHRSVRGDPLFCACEKENFPLKTFCVSTTDGKPELSPVSLLSSRAYHRQPVVDCIQQVQSTVRVMCCGGKEERKFARNVKKPKQFLASLVDKRRINRRSSKPNILLDALLSNAIINIKNDKTSSKLNSILCSNDRNKKVKSCLRGRERPQRSRSDARLGRRAEHKRDNNESEGYTNCLEDVDNFFDDLRNYIEPLSTGSNSHQLDETKKNGDTSSVCQGFSKSWDQDSSACTSPAATKVFASATQDLIDHFIETGLN